MAVDSPQSIAATGSGLLERNLRSLAARDPAAADRIRRAAIPDTAEVTLARTGRPTLTVGGISLHSRFDPEREAAAWAGSEAVRVAEESGRRPVVFGLGLGYHIMELGRRGLDFAVIEPDAGITRLAFSYLDFGPLTGRCPFLVESEPEPLAGPVSLLAHAPSARFTGGSLNGGPTCWAAGNGRPLHQTARTVRCLKKPGRISRA